MIENEKRWARVKQRLDDMTSDQRRFIYDFIAGDAIWFSCEGIADLMETYYPDSEIDPTYLDPNIENVQG